MQASVIRLMPNPAPTRFLRLPRLTLWRKILGRSSGEASFATTRSWNSAPGSCRFSRSVSPFRSVQGWSRAPPTDGLPATRRRSARSRAAWRLLSSSERLSGDDRDVQDAIPQSGDEARPRTLHHADFDLAGTAEHSPARSRAGFRLKATYRSRSSAVRPRRGRRYARSPPAHPFAPESIGPRAGNLRPAASPARRRSIARTRSMPIDSSSWRMQRLSVDCRTIKASAARRKLPWSAAATAYRRC